MIFNQKEATALIQELGQEFVKINNPNYVHPDFEIYPLAPKITSRIDQLQGIVQDMDGTTTTTENLCLYSLETMVRLYSGRLTKSAWHGLNKVTDYPHIIGNSTTKHIEYLIKTYQQHINLLHFQKAYLRSALLTIVYGRDEGRKREVLNNMKYFKCHQIWDEPLLNEWRNTIDDNSYITVSNEVESLITKYAPALNFQHFTDQVRAAIDIYYHTYHDILFKIETNKTSELSALLPEKEKHLIEPMPGVAIFLATVKGWLGEDLITFYDDLKSSLLKNSKIEYDESLIFQHKNKLRNLGQYFMAHPLKIGIVTSSIAYEAHIVLTEVFKVLQKQVEDWKIADSKKRDLLTKFSSYQTVFDSIVTASDSSEIRLKPHRDLYSLALHQLGISKSNFDKIIGFEDSESGAIAIRAAGIGLCVAVPFADTQGHQLDYASHILSGGLPEALLVHQLFLNEKILNNYGL